MKYFSTNANTEAVGFRQATLAGQPAGGGLFFPETIPAFPAPVSSGQSTTKAEASFQIIQPFVGDAIPEGKLFEICEATVNFDFPLRQVAKNIWSLELFHGPTYAFKDVGARFMSRCLGHFTSDISKKIVVIVATSGDTGGAVADGFLGVEGTEVVILYPKGRVSAIQELQLTTLTGNVTALEVAGSFDDCQSLAKRALADPEIQQKIFLTSANSINIARWLPQQFYYAFALQQWAGEAPPVIAVPSGNLGNIAAGFLAYAAGLPIKRFIAACNMNRTLPDYFDKGVYEARAAAQTLSNAMDVGDPSNFVRLLEIERVSGFKVRDVISATSVSDQETASTMKNVYEENGYVLDPHGAVAYRALADDLARQPEQSGIFLATAHPVKFDCVEEIIGTFGDVPSSVSELKMREKKSIKTPPDQDLLRELLIEMA